VFVRQSSAAHLGSNSSQNDHTCPLLIINEENIFIKIMELPSKCSLTPDQIPPLFYKRVAQVILEPRYLIHCRSYEDGAVPECFRKSIVTPIHKKGLKSKVDNYRPVAQSCIACIIFEKLLVDHIFNFLSAQGALDEHQHGFTKGKSTTTQLVAMVQDWAIYIDKKRPFNCIYFDYSKAFDRVNHSTLLAKLRLLEIDARSVRWIASYLSNRSFSVRVNSSFSGFADCPSGVPQGSCLGPILFCIYILDLKDALPSSINHRLYADDLKLYGPSSTEAECQELQNAINAVSNWCVSNDMLISVPKCAALCFKNNFSYLLNGEPIPILDSVRDLGVLISPELDFNRHIAQVVQSATLVCNTLLRCFIVKTPEFYVNLYKSLVIPRLTYCCEVWRPYLKKHIEAIEKVQSKFVRRLAARCGVERSSIPLAPIVNIFNAADMRLFNRISKSDRCEKYFNIRRNNLRSGSTISAVAVAKTERINNIFSFRVARMLSK